MQNYIIFLSLLLCFCEFVESKADPSGLNNFRGNRDTRRLVIGGLEKQDPKDPKYLVLAKESLKKYVNDSGDERNLEVSRVEAVTTQIVSGIATRINFVVKPAGESEFNCFSKIWEKSWENFKEIDVICETNKKQVKRQSAAGGEEEQDPKDKKYFALAEESLNQYAVENHISLEVSRVENVTTQLVEGLLTRIYFVAKRPDKSELKCFSKIWEKSWENFKQIDVTCETDKKQLKRRSVFGGEEEQDPKDEKYLALAKESLNKYATENHISLELSRVEKVTTQTVAGVLTRIYFVAKRTDESELTCFSKIWEKSWENFKEIDVTCETDKKQVKRRDVPGGEVEQDPKDEKYLVLAKESLNKYAIENHINLEVFEVDRVTTQVVQGLLTRINFVAKRYDELKLECFSKIWEKVWENFKDIEVTCSDILSI